MMESIIVTVMIYILTPGAIKIDASSRNDDEKLSGELLFPVSYTHLTLPTIYSV